MKLKLDVKGNDIWLYDSRYTEWEIDIDNFKKYLEDLDLNIPLKKGQLFNYNRNNGIYLILIKEIPQSDSHKRQLWFQAQEDYSYYDMKEEKEKSNTTNTKDVPEFTIHGEEQDVIAMFSKLESRLSNNKRK